MVLGDLEADERSGQRDLRDVQIVLVLVIDVTVDAQLVPGQKLALLHLVEHLQRADLALAGDLQPLRIVHRHVALDIELSVLDGEFGPVMQIGLGKGDRQIGNRQLAVQRHLGQRGRLAFDLDRPARGQASRQREGKG